MKEKVYDLLGVDLNAGDAALLLNQAYATRDQEAMRNGTWDYDNPDFICLRVVKLIEQTPSEELTEEERDWFQEILWFWHHHAITCAIWKRRDQKRARQEATLALRLQSADHPNRITRLLYLLVHDRVEEAKLCVAATTYTIVEGEEIEKKTAQELLKDYQSPRWPFPHP